MTRGATLGACATLLAALGCAPAQPSFAGGSTTPHRRGDVALGAAARLPLGDLRAEETNDSRFDEGADSGGVVPVAVGRYGLLRDWDLGLVAAGTLLRPELRRETVLREDTTRPALLYGIAPYYQAIAEGREGDGRGHRMGLEIPFFLAVEIAGAYEAWAGPRLAVERVFGDFGTDGSGTEVEASATFLRAGATAGMALGFRRAHVLMELSAEYQHGEVDQGGSDLDRSGWILTPALGLRLRL